jgi:GDP-L-fucose synthase
MISKEVKIYIAGHNGMVGSACWRVLGNAGYENLIGRSSKELDLRNQLEVSDFLAQEKPFAIIDAAAKVGGILANDSYPYEFLMDNMLIQNNLISAAHQLNIEKFIFLGSSCIFPKLANQPLKEEYLLSGPLEATNEWYAIAKISGVKSIEALKKQYNRNYVSLMPTNLYGPGDNYDLESSHVLPAMIRKFHEAKVNNDNVILWGSGNPLREFLHVDDLALAVKFTLENDLPESLYNVGFGSDLSISQLAQTIKEIVEYEGKIIWDQTKPDGTPKKLLDSTKFKTMGWKPSISLRDGIYHTYKNYIKIHNNVRNNGD